MNSEDIKKSIGAGIQAAPDVYEAILTRQIKSKDLGIKQSTLSHWRKEGLFIHEKDFEKHEHIKFSLVEFVWLNIIAEFRKYNVAFRVIRSIKKILTFKILLSELMEDFNINELANKKLPEHIAREVQDLLHEPETIKQAEKSIEYNALIALIQDSIIYETQFSLLVNSAGESHAFRSDMIEQLLDDEELRVFLQKTFISVSISEIITRYLKVADLKFCSGKLRLISDREAEIIRILRDEKISSMTIQLSDNNTIQLIELEEEYNRIEKESRLIDFIIKNGYQTIEIKTQDGKIVHCRNLRKIKLK